MPCRRRFFLPEHSGIKVPQRLDHYDGLTSSRPDTSASRWVIDFNNRTEAEAATYKLPYTRVHEQVRPERLKNNRKPRRDYWWQFAERAAGMRMAISALSEVLVIARISKTVMPLRIPTGSVMNEKTVVFTGVSYSDQALLSSNLHWLWTVKYTSTMRADINYSPSDVFLTFPRPIATPGLEEVGRALDEERREIMLRRGLGLTKLYNLLNDPNVRDLSDKDIARLRQIHANVDREAVHAYGWDDIVLDHGFYSYRQLQRWSVAPPIRAELLDRLLEENHRRATSTSGSL